MVDKPLTDKELAEIKRQWSHPATEQEEARIARHIPRLLTDLHAAQVRIKELEDRING